MQNHIKLEKFEIVFIVYEGCPKIPWTSRVSQLSDVSVKLNFDHI